MPCRSLALIFENAMNVLRLSRSRNTMRALMMRAANLAALAVLAVLSWPTAVAGREPSLKQVLARLETYLSAYEAELATLVAEEQYEQWIGPAGGGTSSSRRVLTSDFGFLRLPGRPEWLGLRDTFAVDGRPLPDHQGRVDRLLAEGSSNPGDLARRIVDENARYNLGIVARTINVPMLALDFLGRRHRWRLSFHKRGEEQLDGRPVWAVDFKEREHPTLVKTPEGRERPARGTVWIDPADGSVWRTSVAFDGGRTGAEPATTITVLYRREVTLGLLVPDEMREVYRVEGRASASEQIDARARYSNFRQFRTSARIVAR
jgi:hypothetical protein